MGKSYATVTVADFDIGPCQVTFGSTDIGGTHGNVTIKFKYDKANLTADQYGKTILDQAVSGLECTVETEFLETRDKTNFALLFPDSTLAGTSPHKYIDFKDATANRQLPLAKALTLHPLIENATDHDNDWYFYKAVPQEDSQYVFSPTEQAKLKINWRILLDVTTNPAVMFRAGDHTL